MLKSLRNKPIHWNTISRIGLVHLLSTSLLTGSAFAYETPIHFGKDITQTKTESSARSQEIKIQGKVTASDGSGALPGCQCHT